MNNLGILLAAMFRNKFRFNEATSKKKRIGTIVLFAVAYIAVMAIFMLFTAVSAETLVANGLGAACYLMILMSGAGIVLVFGIVYLISTLYLAKDTDFYSTLPVKPTTVFAAKLLFVYLTETAIVYAVILPVLILFGALAKAWVGYYIISIVMLAVVPALPLSVAAIFAVPIMYLAGKLRNRSVVVLVFYCILFGGFFALYFFMVFGMNNIGAIDAETVIRIYNAIGYALYPFTALSLAAFKIPSFGLSSAASVVAELSIFVGISAVLFGILLLLGKFMYAQSAKANNQTDNSKAKKGAFKSSSGTKALIKREYSMAMRTTSTAFQCFGVLILPIVLSIALSIAFNSTIKSIVSAGAENFDVSFFFMLVFAAILAVLGSAANAAATTFSREGKNISSLKVLPLGIKTILKGKIIAWGVIAVPVAVVSITVPNIFMFDIAQLFLSVICIAAFMVNFIAFGALWDLCAPKLNWIDPKDAVKHNTHVLIGQFICMGTGLVCMIALMVAFSIESAVDFTTIKAVVWSIAYILLVALTAANILLYRRAEKNYNRIEI